MSIETSLMGYLAIDSRYKAVCTASPYPLLLPTDSTSPSLTYQTISATTDATMDGPLNLKEIRLQTDAWSQSYLDVKSLQDAVRAVINGLAMTLPDGTVVINVIEDDSGDLYEPDSRLFRARTDYRVQFSQ